MKINVRNALALVGALLLTTSSLSYGYCAAPCEEGWEGLYIGGFTAYCKSNRKGTSDTFFLLTEGEITREHFNYDTDGALIGANLGCNHVLGCWLFGGEVSASLADVDGRYSNEMIKGTGEYTWFATASLRAGRFVWNNLLYVKGGIGLTGFEYNDNFGCEFYQARHGWLIGAGVERKICGDCSIRLEYSYTDFGCEEDHCNALADLIRTDVKTNSNAHRFTIGFNYPLYGRR